MSGGQAVPAADSKPVFATSVRNMVEFLLKSGSIETGGATSVLDMSIGAAIHRKLQRQAKDELEDYRSEVRLACDCDCGDLVLTVRGSADGVARRADGVTIEEIKSISVEAALVKESDRRLHWAQAMCYGYMLCLAEPLEQVTLELVYYEVKTDRITRQQRVLTKQELYDFFNDLVERYAVWMRWKMRHQADRAATAAALAFPFGQFRRGQRTVAGEVYRAVRDGQCLFVSAPTGIGKTMATLYPAVKAQGEGIGDKVFYLTAKTMTRQAAASALALLEQGGLEYRAVTLTAKDKLCPYERRCNPVDCPYADGYYDKINDAVFGLLHTGTLFSPQDIREAAERYAVCPFELSLDLSVWCDCVIGDYNHLFDPIVHLQRFFGEDRTDHVVLVDEAHNLVDRGREMFSSTLCKKQWDEAGKAIKTGRPGLYKKIRKVAGHFRSQDKALRTDDGQRIYEAAGPFPSELFDAVSDFCEAYAAALQEETFQPYTDETLPLFFEARMFVLVGGLYDERYTTYWQRSGGDLSVRLYCVDPSHLLQAGYDKCRSVTLFSATLLPLDYYRRMLSEQPFGAVSVPSPFDPEHLLVLLHEGISTRYRDRERSYQQVAEAIRTAVSQKIGNYLVFFPSFSYLGQVQPLLDELDALLLPQTTEMDEAQRAEYLAQFEQFGDRTRIGLCVVGGIFSEGIDLTGDRVCGVVVVGVGLPQVGFARDLIRTHFEEVNQKGYLYAYQYPGLNRVFQAAGRLIRTETDQGFVLLIDDRYAQGGYVREYPAHWKNNRRIRDTKEIGPVLQAFWSADAAPDDGPKT